MSVMSSLVRTKHIIFLFLQTNSADNNTKQQIIQIQILNINGSDHLIRVSIEMVLLSNIYIVGDTNMLSCEPQGIPQKGHQITCTPTIYFNDVICKLV